MRNAKLWSVLLAAVLVCACIAGVLFTGASASDTRIPTATTTYVVGTDGATIRACLEKAAAQTWAEDTVLEIQFSGEDSSIYASPDATNGISGYTMFEVNSIFREDNTQLPIVIRGMDENRAATIKTAENSYNATNDYFFTNLTIAGGASKATVSFYAGSGELVFENTKHNNYNYTWYYGDCQATDAWEGWDAAKLEANKGDKGLVETGIVFGNGTKFYDTFVANNDDTQRISAVGFNGDTTTNPVLVALKRTADDVTAALTEDEVEGVRDAAKNATYKQGNVVTIDECLVKPWDTQTYLVLDSGTANPTSYEYGYASARKGVSPVQEAKIEAISGGYQYLTADCHTSKTNETYAGNTTVIVRGGKTLSTAVGIRLTNIAMLIGDLTLEIHEDDPSVPTYTTFVQASQSGATSTVFGNYHFLMTGGTIGKGHSVATLGSDGNQLEDSNGKKWTHYDPNDGYWGAPLATGTIVNEVQGGTIWAFYGSRYANSYVNTPVSIVLPGTGETLTAMVSVHNKISGGIIGGPKVEGDRTDSAGNKVDIQQGTKAFYGGSKGSSKVTAVCNEITGGTIYKFNAGSVGTSRSYAPADLYNFIYGTKEAYPTFLCDFYGCNSKGAYNITNVIKGYPKFNDGTTKRWIHGGHALNGTTESVTNYLGGLPEFKDFFGGTPSNSLSTKSNAAVKVLRNHFAFDDTEKVEFGEIWAGNAYFQIVGRDDVTKPAGNSNNYVKTTLETTIYSGTYSIIRNESAAGADEPSPVLTVKGGTFKDAFMPVNRNAGDSYKNRTCTTNIYGGTFEKNLYMGGKNSRNQPFVNNIYGGTFNAAYYGGGENLAGSVTNNIYGGTFNADYCGGGVSCNSDFVVNNIKGGTFNANWYGGSAGSVASVDCPSITNTFDGGEGNKTTNKHIYLGNGVPAFNGVVTTVINNFTANKSYIHGGSAAAHNAPEGAAYAIDTTINGGTFCGFWGQGGGKTSVLTGNVRTTVNGGTFKGYSSTMPNSIAGGSRNGSTTGNIELIINGGTFTADVVGGIIVGSTDDSLKKIVGDVTTTIKGGDFRRDIHAIARTASIIDLTGTAAINVEHTAGKELSFAGNATVDLFKANENNEAVNIGKNTNIVIEKLEGKLVVNQTEGWDAHDYLTIPAGSEYEVLESPEIYGFYEADDAIVVKGGTVAPVGATIRLAERLGVRILLDPDEVDAYGDKFTYTVKLGNTTLATGGYEEIKANNYSILFDGIGLTQFAEEFVVTGPFIDEIRYSIVDLAKMAQTAWANNANWKAYADAIIELHNVYSGGENTLTPAAVEKTPVAAKGELGDAIVACEETNATLLMSDAAGVRMSIVLTEAPANAKFVVAGKEFAAKIEGNTISADIFFAHEFLADEFVISVQNAEGQVYMTYTASIEAMANQLANDDTNEQQNNAIAFLCYIQKAVACK